MKNSLTKKEKEFCRNYARLQNSREAAYLAGYTALPAVRGERLLARQEIRNEIKQQLRLSSDLGCAAAGLRRLAFGSVADAVRLIHGETDNPDSLDLFMVSDIKLPKGGGMEIKFYDRLKALESLAVMESSSADTGATEFYRALEGSARALSERQDKDEG